MAIYIVAMESANGQKTASICATGRTRKECIQNAVNESSARDGVVYRATATTNLKSVVDAPLLPPIPSPRKIYVSPKPEASIRTAEQQVDKKQSLSQSAPESGPFDAVLEVLRKERNRCIGQGDVEGARGFDLADAELRAAILDNEGGI